VCVCAFAISRVRARYIDAVVNLAVIYVQRSRV